MNLGLETSALCVYCAIVCLTFFISLIFTDPEQTPLPLKDETKLFLLVSFYINWLNSASDDTKDESLCLTIKGKLFWGECWFVCGGCWRCPACLLPCQPAHSVWCDNEKRKGCGVVFLCRQVDTDLLRHRREADSADVFCWPPRMHHSRGGTR